MTTFPDLTKQLNLEVKARLAFRTALLEKEIREQLVHELLNPPPPVGNAGVLKFPTIKRAAKQAGIPLATLKLSSVPPSAVVGLPIPPTKTRKSRRRSATSRRTKQSHKGLVGDAWRYIRKNGVATSATLGPALNITVLQASSALSKLSSVHPTSIRRVREGFGPGQRGSFFRYNYVGRR